MIELDAFIDRVMERAPMAPEPFVAAKVVAAAIELCEKGRVWRAYDTYSVKATEDEISLCDPDQASIYEIRSALFNDGPPLTVMTSVELDQKWPGWRQDTVEGCPTVITQLSQNAVTIYQRGTGTLAAELILKPSRKADQLPDFLYEDHLETIAHGAAAMVLITPARDFTNPQLAGAEFQMFNAALDTLRTGRGPRGKIKAPIRSKSRFL